MQRDTTGDRLRRALEERHISLSEASRRTGISYAAIRRMVSGDMIGRVSSWVIVSRCLGICIDELLGKRENMEGISSVYRKEMVDESIKQVITVFEQMGLNKLEVSQVCKSIMMALYTEQKD